jgi:hypothetical protein
MNKFAGLAAAVALLFVGSNASAAITYVANRALGSGSIDLSITTDGTLGDLAAANFLDWTIMINTGVETATLHGPPSSTAGVYLANFLGMGSAVTATSTDLFYNFSLSGSLFQFYQDYGDGNYGTYCLQLFNCVIYEPGVASEQIRIVHPGSISSFTSQAYTGNQIIGSVAPTGPGPVPEPATWAMMILGFGAAGSLLRRRRVVPA